MKVFLHRHQQYNQFTQLAMLQPFYQMSTMENDGKHETTPQPPIARQTNRFQGKGFLCDKPGPTQKECGQQASDTENGTFRTRERQQNTDVCPLNNLKLVCQDWGYIGHSTKHCNQRQNLPPHRAR